MVARNFESPVDANTDNVYEVSIFATDSDGNTDNENQKITIADAIDIANFSINAFTDVFISGNSTFTSSTPSLSGDTPIGEISYSISGVDANLFTINSTTGVISMVARDFNNPEDSNTDNVYEVTIIATDKDNNTASSNQKVTVTLASIYLGTQTWTASNLALVPTSYNNLGYDYFDNYVDSEGNGVKADEDGWYYSYDAARNVCPSGWRLPSDDDWKTLEGFLGMSVTDQNSYDLYRGDDEGAKLKAGGSSGFNAKLAGHISLATGKFSSRGLYSTFWTSTINISTSGDNTEVYPMRRISYDNNLIERQAISVSVNNNNYSVRCVK
jgi:uncharacterized protein (TIGR02145 family)